MRVKTAHDRLFVMVAVFKDGGVRNYFDVTR